MRNKSPQLKVNVQIRDCTTLASGPTSTNTCYSTNSCSTIATMPYTSGHYYQTVVSGYVGSWQAYYQSGCVYFP